MDLSYLILNYGKSYFAIADEYIELQKIFMKETFLENLTLWIDMIIYPIYLIIFNRSLNFFTLSSLQRIVSLWIKWFKYQHLNTEVRKWTKIVRSVGGPFISTNDPTYHMYVYADGMTRLDNSLLGKRILTKKSTKSL